MHRFSDLFTPRQLVALTTFSDLVQEARKQLKRDALDAGLPDDGMSLVGGAIGLVIGLIGSAMIAYFLQWPTAVPVMAVLGAFGFSACVGIVFGYYPARKAASLDPIDALRYE
jgi:putative ABC transport system permease protein